MTTAGLRMLGILCLAGTATVVATGPAAAQGHEITLEASILGGAAGYARSVTEQALIGLQLGAGLPQVDLTLHPGSETGTGSVDLEEYLYLAAFVRLELNGRTDLDLGIRGGVADLYECTNNDCWPASFVGAYLQPMWGGARWKVGARLVAVLVGESPEGGPESSTFALGVSPVLVRLSVPW